MKLSAFLATAASAAVLFGSTLNLINPAAAKATTICPSSTAGSEDFALRSGGASHDFAYENAVVPRHDGTQACEYKMRASLKFWTRYGY